MNWRIKGMVQKSLSVLPGGMALNDVLQRTIGGLHNFEASVASKVNADWVVLAGHMHELGVPLVGKSYMEIGTGWYPTLPICWHLAGASSVITFDLQRHLNVRLTKRMLKVLESHLPSIASAANRSLPDVRSAYLALSATRLPFEYRAPADATQSGLPDNSIDVVFSNSVLEHVPRPVIAAMMRESARVLRPGGIAMHSVNCADHYAYFDKNITFMNYYRFTEEEWQFWNNDLQYQNRLRPQDFLNLAEEAGLKIVLAKHRPRQTLLDALPSLCLAPEFQHYPPEQLCTTSVDFVTQKP